MEIVNARIDERMIHGQVAAIWTNLLNATRILVIDDQAAQDDIQKMALRMACPSTVKLSILSGGKSSSAASAGSISAGSSVHRYAGPGNCETSAGSRVFPARDQCRKYLE